MKLIMEPKGEENCNVTELTKEIGEPLGLLVMLDRYSDCVEENQNDDEPVEPLRFDRVPNPKSESLFSQPETLAASLIWNFWFEIT